MMFLRMILCLSFDVYFFWAYISKSEIAQSQGTYMLSFR